MSKAPLSYVLRAFSPPNDLRIAAWLPCSKCQTVGKVHVQSWGNNPEKIEKHFNLIGWEANVHNRSLCPVCVSKKKKQEELLRREPLAKDVATRVIPTINQPEEPMALVSHTRTAGKPGGITSIKELTPEQRTALRRELDSLFDDSKGRYLEGQSDHSISERTKIPRVVVAEFRSLSYGELKEDPEVAAIRAQLDQAKKLMEDIKARLDRAEASLIALARR